MHTTASVKAQSVTQTHRADRTLARHKSNTDEQRTRQSVVSTRAFLQIDDNAYQKLRHLVAARTRSAAPVPSITTCNDLRRGKVEGIGATLRQVKRAGKAKKNRCVRRDARRIIPVGAPPRSCRHAAGIGAGPRLGEAEAAHEISGCEARQELYVSLCMSTRSAPPHPQKPSAQE